MSRVYTAPTGQKTEGLEERSRVLSGRIKYGSTEPSPAREPILQGGRGQW